MTAAFERVLSRPPTPAEMGECVAFLNQSASPAPATAAPVADGKKPAADPMLRARENLVQVLMNHHEFVTVR